MFRERWQSQWDKMLTIGDLTKRYMGVLCIILTTFLGVWNYIKWKQKKWERLCLCRLLWGLQSGQRGSEEEWGLGRVGKIWSHYQDEEIKRVGNRWRKTSAGQRGGQVCSLHKETRGMWPRRGLYLVPLKECRGWPAFWTPVPSPSDGEDLHTRRIKDGGSLKN